MVQSLCHSLRHLVRLSAKNEITKLMHANRTVWDFIICILRK
ncbi:MAG: hypothetical protein AVDCRST_MAG96-3116 [uncultured Segetibacter sp.]|uniref:Uncharacterized protein n=1 Tax=uncultured Segetibacter sp. TaxID=481133 RepID=A0A6J4TJV1_9BACT|nr:MAG: hypothetical protein AVDCRST_MAG96-3116 [uncultured Segetibacter sp.]